MDNIERQELNKTVEENTTNGVVWNKYGYPTFQDGKLG